jgi:hypothetical protein
VPAAAAGTVIGVAHEHGIEAMVVGEVVDAAATGGRYVEGALESVG